MGAAHFRWAAKQKANLKLSASTEGGKNFCISLVKILTDYSYILFFLYSSGSSLLDPADRTASRSSLDSHEALPVDNSFLNKFRKVANIVKNNLNGSNQSMPDLVEKTEQEEGQNGSNEEEDAEEVGENQFVPPPHQRSPSECRMLSRSESAGDANIIDKLQQNNNNKKNCARTLTFNGQESPGK